MKNCVGQARFATTNQPGSQARRGVVEHGGERGGFGLALLSGVAQPSTGVASRLLPHASGAKESLDPREAGSSHHEALA